MRIPHPAAEHCQTICCGTVCRPCSASKEGCSSSKGSVAVVVHAIVDRGPLPEAEAPTRTRHRGLFPITGLRGLVLSARSGDCR